MTITSIHPGADESVSTARPHSLGNLVLLGSFLVSGAVALLVAMTLHQSREEAWSRARQSSQNIVNAMSQDIEHRVQLYSFIIGDIIDDISDPGVVAGYETLHRFLKRAASISPYLGSLVLINSAGDIVVDADSQVPRSGNFQDRDYFQVHQNTNSDAVYISKPYESRLRNGDPSIALSRRVNNEHGAFDGVVVAALRLTYFRDMFRNIDVGPGGALTLTRTDGTLLMREPSLDGAGDIGRDLSSSPVFKRIQATRSGSFVAVAQLDGVERLYTYTHVANAPLIVSVGVAVETILSGWRQRAIVIGSLTGLICFTGIGAAMLSRREMIRRARVEAELQFLSVTDGLTRVANRRRFDEVLSREWSRASRTGSPLALLALDADHFKQLNDRFGHGRGDEILSLLARIMEEAVRRPDDLVARIGGEEFAVLLPNTDADGAARVAEQIRKRVEAASLPGPQGEPIRITVSIGVASNVPGISSPARLLELADKALYQAKGAGRNAVVVATGNLPGEGT